MTYQSPETRRARRVFRARQTIRADQESIFPLLCPVREFDWIPGWDCQLIYTESGIAEPFCVFQTDREADGGLDTWVISQFEPPRSIGFIRVNELRTIGYDITLKTLDDAHTRLEWVQVVTALSEAGDEHVRQMDEDRFRGYIVEMESLMQSYVDRACKTTLTG